MSERQNPTTHAADDSALTGENLESVAGGVGIIDPTLIITPTVCPPPFGPVAPTTDPAN